MSKPAAAKSAKRRRGARHLSQAYAHHRAGDLEAAERAYRKVLQCDPTQAQALQHVAAFEIDRGGHDEALNLLRRAVEADPEDAVCRNNLGNLLQVAGRFDEAVEHYQVALRIVPRHESACFNLAKTLQKQGRFESAVERLADLTSWRRDDPEAWTALGLALQDAGRIDEAIAAHRRAIALRPHLAAAHNNLGAALMDLGDFASATAAFQAAIEHDPECFPAYGNLVKTRRFDRPRDAGVVTRMEKLLERLSPGDPGGSDLYFALAKIAEDFGEHSRAFEHLRAGNALNRRLVHFDREDPVRRVDALIATFGPDLLRRCEGYGDPCYVPLLIVGMPRSGTSLVEQMLASHPRVMGAGEQPYLERLALGLAVRLETEDSYPECAARIDALQARALGEDYVAALLSERSGPGPGVRAARVTDKMPSNYLHLGLAAIALPNVRVVHCQRGAMDTCLSIYSRQFTHRQGYAYTHDLEDIAAEYRAYHRLMTHWRSMLGSRMLEVRYEDLLSETEPTLRSLLDFCGLPWDERCLRFHESPRVVRTASNWQVRQPLYQHAVERWRRYRTELEPLRQALAPVFDGEQGSKKKGLLPEEKPRRNIAC